MYLLRKLKKTVVKKLIYLLMLFFILIYVIIVSVIAQTLLFISRTNQHYVIQSDKWLTYILKNIKPNITLTTYTVTKHEKEHSIKTVKNKVFTNLHDEALEAEIIKDDNFKVQGLAENGVGVQLIVDEEHQKEMEKNGGFNAILNEMISYSREIPDSRYPECKNVSYDKILPIASVVIIFHNEPWSSLIRTVHSVINRSPQHLIEEIILVDDFSDKNYLKEKLDYYIRTRLPSKVKLIRLKERSGLIRARLAGAEKCVGDVIVFMDAHCEVGYTWLEPLLQRIKEKRNAVVIPVVDSISSKTLEYLDYVKKARFIPIGSFLWNGHFYFIPMSKIEEEKRRGSRLAPARNPVMVGCFFAINREYFWEIGSFDSQMDIWGAENLEISFRIWQCGGTLEAIPCSKVGHMFQKVRPYTFPREKDTHKYNAARMAEVWMDEFKTIFYLYHPELKGKNVGDLTERHEIRQRLKCKSFKWYLDNVHPELFVPIKNSIAYGQVRALNICLDNIHFNYKQYLLAINECNSRPVYHQVFFLEENGELRLGNFCAEIKNITDRPTDVIMCPCHGKKGNQQWKLTEDGELVHVETGLCLDAYDELETGNVRASLCNKNVWQKWEMGLLQHNSKLELLIN